MRELRSWIKKWKRSSSHPRHPNFRRYFFGGRGFFLGRGVGRGWECWECWCWMFLLGVHLFLKQKVMIVLPFFWLQGIFSNCTRERERETDREMLEHHTNTLIDWKHWTRSSDLLKDVGSSFHSVSRQFNDQSLLNASVAPGIGTRRLVLVRSAYIPFLQIESWFSRTWIPSRPLFSTYVGYFPHPW